jgi:hypothetical protein
LKFSRIISYTCSIDRDTVDFDLIITTVEELSMSSKHAINRRDFLKTGGSAVAGAAALASGTSALAASPPLPSMKLATLDAHEGETLLKMCRAIYPHPSLADSYYAPLVESLDKEAGEVTETADLLKQGVADLDAAMGIRWLDLSDGNQLQVLKGLESGPFFQKIKGKTVSDLYNNPLVWRHFGYEGDSFSHGGYMERGFNDLTWLPDPPAEASPKGWWEDNNG